MAATRTEETPRAVVERLFAQLPARDADAFVAFLASDAVFEIPFPVPGMPTRLEGKEAIREHLAQRWSGLPGLEVHGISSQVYETADPELLFVENDIDMTVPGAGRIEVRTSVNVVRVENGEVTLFRDYMDTARTARLVEG